MSGAEVVHNNVVDCLVGAADGLAVSWSVDGDHVGVHGVGKLVVGPVWGLWVAGSLEEQWLDC